MNRARDLLLLLFALAIPALAARGLRDPPWLGAPGSARATPCEVPIEVAGAGVGCVSKGAARQAKARPGDRLRLDGGRLRRERMAPERLRAWRVPIDPNRASALELTSLEEIGPRLAERIVLSRPFRRVEELARVPGIGGKRLERLRPRLSLDE